MDFSATLSPSEKMQTNLEVDRFNKTLTVNGRKASQELGKDDFLKLLMAQMTHQDPTEPMDNSQFIAQMAQFSSLEQMYNVSSGFTKMAQMMQSSEAAGTLGKVVDLDVEGEKVTGVVEGFTRGENPQIQVNGNFYNMDYVRAVYSN
ncbi:MAG: flagellar hook assembly protein FlgD [Treponema sp.]|nr:flagellar hook assembly protein FlgD [Treponema sp.]MEE3435265.1 flagellar hook assembly protein FlgD [Treponema sp.]